MNRKASPTPPRRCPDCRAQRKAQGGFGGGRRGGGPREMHSAVCRNLRSDLPGSLPAEWRQTSLLLRLLPRQTRRWRW